MEVTSSVRIFDGLTLQHKDYWKHNERHLYFARSVGKIDFEPLADLCELCYYHFYSSYIEEP